MKNKLGLVKLEIAKMLDRKRRNKLGVEGKSNTRPVYRPAQPGDKQMATQTLNERFSQLAGIKPLYEMDDEEMESTKEITKEELLNEGPELWTALGGLVGLIGAAGITTQLQMMAEDPAIAEKYPKLEKIFTFLAKVGGAVGSGIKEGGEEEEEY